MKSRIKAKSPKKAVKSVALSAKPASAPVPASRRPQGPGKTFHKDGHWIENPRKNIILVCACGNKYLKTRHGQNKCLRCVSLGR